MKTDCVYIIASYDTLDMTTTTLVWKWSDYPLMSLNKYYTLVDYGIKTAPN